MTFWRGIFFGILMVIGSIGEIMQKSDQYFFGVNKTLIIVLLSISCVLGIMQIVSSINYLKAPKAKILLFCFALEGIYYAIITVFLISMEINIGIKIFGVTVSFILLIVICTAISNLWKKIIK